MVFRHLTHELKQLRRSIFASWHLTTCPQFGNDLFADSYLDCSLTSLLYPSNQFGQPFARFANG